LLAQLYHRASTPAHSPQGQHILPHPTFGSQPWIATSAPQQQMFAQGPTTPPSAYPPQPSPFSTSPYTQDRFLVSGQQQHQQEQMPDWNSGQALPELPQPSEGRMRHALVYGPGLPPPRPKSNQGNAGGQPQ
jgi:hypothetical protein